MHLPQTYMCAHTHLYNIYSHIYLYHIRNSWSTASGWVKTQHGDHKIRKCRKFQEHEGISRRFFPRKIATKLQISVAGKIAYIMSSRCVSACLWKPLAKYTGYCGKSMSEHKLDRRFKNHCEWNNETKGRYISTRVIVFYTRVNYISDCPLTKITGFFFTFFLMVSLQEVSQDAPLKICANLFKRFWGL